MTVPFRPGERVQEIAPPQRRGTVQVQQGTGATAIIIVRLDGRPPASFRPSELIRLS